MKKAEFPQVQISTYLIQLGGAEVCAALLFGRSQRLVQPHLEDVPGGGELVPLAQLHELDGGVGLDLSGRLLGPRLGGVYAVDLGLSLEHGLQRHPALPREANMITISE